MDKWLKYALIRALKTVFQTALSLLTVSVSSFDINWIGVLVTSLIAGAYSILTSIATGMPEVDNK